EASAESLERLRGGVVLDDGEKTRPAKVRLLEPATPGKHTWIEIAIREGRNRQVRRMAEAIGHPVLKLSRVAYGPITAAGMRPGDVRPLRADELEALRAQGGLRSAA